MSSAQPATVPPSDFVPVAKRVSGNSGFVSSSSRSSRSSSPGVVPPKPEEDVKFIQVTAQASNESLQSVDDAGVVIPTITVMNPDKSKMIKIPTHLIEPTAGSKKFASDPKKNNTMNAFKFHLCVEHRKETGGCPLKGECNFIHSRHTIDHSLMPQVKERDVHVCVDAMNWSQCPYPTHPYDDADQTGSKNIVVYDNSIAQYILMEAGCAYITKGSIFALADAAKSPGGLVVRQVVSEKLRVCFCTHYDRGWCARGDSCLYVHRVKMNGHLLHNKKGAVAIAPPIPSANQPHNLQGTPNMAPKQTVVIPPAAVPASMYANAGQHRSPLNTVATPAFLQPFPFVPPPQQQPMYVQQPMFVQPQQQQPMYGQQHAMLAQPQQQQALYFQPQQQQQMYFAGQQPMQPVAYMVNQFGVPVQAPQYPYVQQGAGMAPMVVMMPSGAEQILFSQ